jgi:diguanylate cyclase (GGDEF)-like protein/PAS domain S-box-containing protein
MAGKLTPLGPEALDTSLNALLAEYPTAFVAAINDDGVFVPMPASVSLTGQQVLKARSMLDLVVSEDRQRVISTWERARETGASSAQMRLELDPGRPAVIHYLDARARHGVYVGIVVGGDAAALRSLPEIQPTPPRIARVRKNEVAVFLEVDEATSKILGWTAADMVGLRSLDFIHPEDQDRAIESWMQMLSEPGIVQPPVRLRHRRSDGSWTWFEVTNHNLIADPDRGYVLAEIIDISDEMAAQEALREREQLLEAVLGVIGALVVILDPQGQVVSFNGACERLSGYPAADILGRPLWDVLFPSDEVEQVRAMFDDLRAGAFPKSFESHWMTRTGALRLIRWENTCRTDEGSAVTHVIATGIDITDRKKVEEELSHELTLMHALMDNLPIQLYFKDRESRFIRISNHGAKTLGLSDPGQAIGKTDFDFFTDEHAQQANEDEREIIRTGQAHNTEEKETRTGLPDIWVSTTKLPLRDTDERIIGTFGISVDITDRRKAEEALRERARVFAALAAFAAAVNAIREPALLAAALVDAVGAVVPVDTVVIIMLDRGDGLYRVSAVRGLAPGAIGAIIEPGDGHTGRAISERTVILTEPHPRAQSNAALRDYLVHETTWAVGVPLIHEDTVLGVISVGRFEADAPFTPAEIEVFTLLGAHAALALANAYLVEEVSALAIHDGLTGLYNRRHFDAEFDHLIARFKRRAPAGNLAAIMFDLDHFGNFNRQHGHLVGDAVLRLFAGVLHERLRSADLVARFGGEEFVVILEDCALPEVVRVADEVRRGLEVRTVPGADGKPLRVTVSAGCAVIDPADPTRDALLSRADVALFMAKRAGRNQVVAA